MLLQLAVAALAAIVASADAVETAHPIYYNDMLYGPDNPLAELVEWNGVVLEHGRFLPHPDIVVLKSDYKLLLYSGESLLKTYRIQLGKDPVGPKMRYGDGRTPEGHYTICAHNPNSTYYLSLELDYPNADDAARGLAAGVLEPDEAEALRLQHATDACPDPQTALGGEIFIHGQHPKTTATIKARGPAGGGRHDLLPGDQDPSGLKISRNWTLGCIALTNPDIREIYQFVPDGTPVTIMP